MWIQLSFLQDKSKYTIYNVAINVNEMVETIFKELYI